MTRYKKTLSFIILGVFLVILAAGIYWFQQKESDKVDVLFEATWDTDTEWGLTETPEYVSNVVGYGGAGQPEAIRVSSGDKDISAYAGDGYLKVSGKDISDKEISHAYFRLFNELNITIANDTKMKYWVYHHEYDQSANMMFDLIFSDNTTLRDSGITDTNGIVMHPSARNGEQLNKWVEVEVDLSPLAGKVLDKILVAYDNGNLSEVGDYISYFDDLVLTGTDLTIRLDDPRIVSTVFPSSDHVVANAAVTDPQFNADHTGATDASKAIQAAIDAVYNAGGGVVWMPSGTYKLNSNIYVRSHVTLRGDWRDPDVGSGSYGTLVIADVPSGNASDHGLFRVGGSAGVKGITVYYPNQDISSPVEYPYTFEIHGGLIGADYMSASVQNVTMLNSYRGISAGYHSTHEMHLIRDVKGTVLETGLYLEDTSDVGKVNRVALNGSYWASLDASVSDEKPSRAQIDAWTRTNGIGMELRGVEWHQMAEVSLHDFETGIVIDAGRRINYTGMMWGLDVQRSNVALLVKVVDERVGINISNSTFQADQGDQPVAVKITNENGGSVLINNSIIGGGAHNAVQLTGNTMINLQDVTFDSWTDMYAIDASAGTVVVQGSTFTPKLGATKKAIHMQEGVSSASILSNAYSGTVADFVVNSSSGDVAHQDDGYDFKPHNVASYTWRSSIPTPESTNFYNVKLAPYLAAGVPSTPTPLVDDTSAIQSALDAAATDGGGTVYLPAGIYRIEGHLNVPPGVQLRGADDVPHRGDVNGSSGTILYAYEGRGTSTPDTDAPFIQLNGFNSGARGFSVYYPEQASDHVDNIVAYPWTIKGSGDTVYAFDITLINAFKGVDFATGESSDNHYINQVNGFVLSEGIKVGNANEGWVEDSLFNATHWSRAYGLPNKIDEKATLFPVAFAYARQHATIFTVTNGAKNQHLLNNFVYGAHTGLKVEGDANVTAINMAADGSVNTVVVSGTGNSGANIINVEGCGCGLRGTAVSVSGGKAYISNMLTMQRYKEAISVTGGLLVLRGASFHYSVASITGGNVELSGALFKDFNTHVKVEGNATAHLWGNIGAGKTFLYEYADKASGEYSNNIKR